MLAQHPQAATMLLDDGTFALHVAAEFHAGKQGQEIIDVILAADPAAVTKKDFAGMKAGCSGSVCEMCAEFFSITHLILPCFPQVELLCTCASRTRTPRRGRYISCAPQLLPQSRT